MKLLCLLSVVVLAAAKIQYPEEWHLWKATHGKSYASDKDELQKHIVWQSNKEYIERHNQYADQFGYTLKMNHFGDMTIAEFTDSIQCVQEIKPQNITQLSEKYGTKIKQYEPMTSALPDTVDWRTAGAVTHVKDQLRCGCSYAFAAIGALEGASALTTGTLNKLSEQNIVDCSLSYGNSGCSCGDINRSYLYVIDNDGVDIESSYPYKSKQTGCSYDKKYRGTSATGVVTIRSGDESSLATALAYVGPISTYVDAAHSSFQFYSGGLLDVPNCSTTKISHALTMIGYGKYQGKDYWLLKNSWGPNWGDYGYIMMAKGKANQCGIATAASYPTL